MADKNFNTRIVHKHDIEANWQLAVNFTPKQGELIVYDPDENFSYPRIKIGDGEKNVNALPFITDNVSVDKEDLESFFFIVETVKENGTYYLSGITFEEIIEKFNNGGNMVCHVDDTDYIPLLSVTPRQIIFSGIYNSTSVSLVFNTEGVGTLTSTSLCERSSLTTHTSNTDIHVTAAEKEKWNNIEPSITTAIDDGMGNVTLESNAGIAYIEDALKQEIIDAVLASLNTETLTFTLDDGTIVTKEVVVML